MSLFWIGLVATAAVGIGTYFSRAGFILALADRDMAPVVLQALRFVGPAVMAGLVVSLLLDGEAGDGVGWVEYAALSVGGAVGWKTRSLPWVLAAGMVTLWVLRWLFA